MKKGRKISDTEASGKANAVRVTDAYMAPDAPSDGAIFGNFEVAEAFTDREAAATVDEVAVAAAVTPAFIWRSSWGYLNLTDAI